jgi:hypothetical protein
MSANRPARLRRHVRRMANVNRYIKARRGRGRSGERLSLQVPVDRDLRAAFGRACIEHCLKTDSLAVARIRRDERLPAIREMFDAARQERTLGAGACSHTAR